MTLTHDRGRGTPAALLTVLFFFSIVAGVWGGPGTKRMAERLQKVAADCDPLLTPFMNREAAEIFGRQLQDAIAHPGTNSTAPRLVGLRFKYGLELLNSGESEKAIDQFRLLREHVQRYQVSLPEDKVALVRMYEALAW